MLQVFAADNQPLSNLAAFFQARNAALNSGGFFASGLTSTSDSTFGFSPIRHIPGRSSSANTSWRDLGPRVAAAWQIPFTNRIFGNRQTVIRAGYSLLWNRTSGVGEVLTPLLGNGLASVDICAGPIFNGTTTATCSGGSVDASNGFRIGTDGSTVPIPPFTNAPIPLVDTLSNGKPSPFAVSRASIQDPNIRLPYSHNVTLDIQRAFANNWFVDVGYIGRFSRNLWQNVDINAADPFAKTPAAPAGREPTISVPVGPYPPGEQRTAQARTPVAPPGTDPCRVRKAFESESARAIWTWALTGAWMASVGHLTDRAVPGLAQAMRGILVARLRTLAAELENTSSK